MATGLYQYVTDSGVIIPDTSTIKESVEQTYRDTFGKGIDLTEESVGGRLVERDTTALSQTVGVIAQNANQFNTHYATGVYLDHLANMFGVTRQPATNTRVYARVSGTDGTVVTKDALAKTENGDDFACEADITIGSDTFGYGWFVASSTGAIACGIGELNSIQTNISGWTQITNLYGSVENDHPEYATIIGSNVETDAHLRNRLLESVWSGVGFVGSIQARVADVANVKSCRILENNGVQPKVVRGVAVPGHSVCVCVDGGDNTEVARAILASRSAGCGYTSSVEGATNVSVDIPDEYNGIVHTVQFIRPPSTLKGLSVTVTASVNKYTGTKTVEEAVKDSVEDYLDNARIGEAVSDYDVLTAIAESLPSLSVSSVSVKTTGTNPVPIADYTVPAYMKFTCESVTVNTQSE